MRPVIYSHAYGGLALTVGESVVSDRDIAAVNYALENVPVSSDDDTNVVWEPAFEPAGSGVALSPFSARTRRHRLLP
jgi:hypothetical protein